VHSSKKWSAIEKYLEYTRKKLQGKGKRNKKVRFLYFFGVDSGKIRKFAAN
jgi:hypothetical protein